MVPQLHVVAYNNNNNNNNNNNSNNNNNNRKQQLSNALEIKGRQTLAG